MKVATRKLTTPIPATSNIGADVGVSFGVDVLMMAADRLRILYHCPVGTITISGIMGRTELVDSGDGEMVEFILNHRTFALHHPRIPLWEANILG